MAGYRHIKFFDDSLNTNLRMRAALLPLYIKAAGTFAQRWNTRILMMSGMRAALLPPHPLAPAKGSEGWGWQRGK